MKNKAKKAVSSESTHMRASDANISVIPSFDEQVSHEHGIRVVAVQLTSLQIFLSLDNGDNGVSSGFRDGDVNDGER